MSTGDEEAYLTLAGKEFLQAVQDGRVYRADDGRVMRRPRLDSFGNARCASPEYKKAVRFGWVDSVPGAGLRLTAAGEAALAAGPTVIGSSDVIGQ